MNKRIIFSLAGALGLLLMGLTPSVAGVAASPAVPPARGTWALAPINPEYLAYLADLAAGQPVSPIMPRRVDLRALATRRQLSVSPPFPPPTPGNQGSFPSAYDLRTLGRVTPARVSNCGACWTSAALGSLESFFAPFEIWDFSEDHMQLNFGFDYAVCNGGGSNDHALRYLAAWRGPVKETDYSYKSQKPQNPPVQKHVQEAFYLPYRQNPLDNDWLKMAVMFFGGVFSTASDSWGFNQQYNTYYNPVKDSGHAVTIVGWDDNFDRNKFFYNDPNATPDQKIPPGNGAFIAKNNEGPGFGEDGFFYISYYDKAIASDMAMFTGEPATNYNRIYQYDPLGVTDFLVTPNAIGPSYAANVFTAAADDYLTAVSFYNVQNNGFVSMDYQTKVYLDPPEGTPVRVDTAPAAAVKISLILPGYYTVKLPQKVPLTQGQRFSVVLSGVFTEGGWPAFVGIERPIWGFSTATANAGESYISPDGANWQDVTTILTNTNVCLKAFTTPKWYISSITPDLSAQNLAWILVNNSATTALIKPVAQLYRKTKSGFAKFGGVVLANYYLDQSGAKHKIKRGLVQVPPGETLTVYARVRSLARADRVAYNYYGFDPITGLLKLSDIWKYLNLFDELHVVATDPMNNAHVPSPLSIITVTFDKDIKPGPSLAEITVKSSGVPSESKMTYNSVSGNTLWIATTSPLSTPVSEPEGIVWEVHLPSDAVTDLAGYPLQQDYSWSFTVELTE